MDNLSKETREAVVRILKESVKRTVEKEQKHQEEMVAVHQDDNPKITKWYILQYWLPRECPQYVDGTFKTIEEAKSLAVYLMKVSPIKSIIVLEADMKARMRTSTCRVEKY